jgi:hypothetical protein
MQLVPFKTTTSITTGAQQSAGHSGILKNTSDDMGTSGLVKYF